MKLDSLPPALQSFLTEQTMGQEDINRDLDVLLKAPDAYKAAQSMQWDHQDGCGYVERRLWEQYVALLLRRRLGLDGAA